MKFVLENSIRLEIANKKLLNELYRNSSKKEYTKVLFNVLDNNKEKVFVRQGDLYHFNDYDIWFMYQNEFNKFIYAFGIGEIRVNEINTPVIVLDFPANKEEITNSAFIQGEKGYVLLVYKGNYPKFMKQQLNSNDNFFTTEIIEKGLTKKYWLLSKLESTNLVNYLSEFVLFIAKNKDNLNNRLDTKKILDKVDIDKNVQSRDIKMESKSLTNIQRYKCEICGSYFESNLERNLCKICSRKSYAAKNIDEILKFIEPNESFSKTDLLSKVDNKLAFVGYLWTLEEFKLIEFNGITNKYKLKSKSELNDFKNKYISKVEPEVITLSPKIDNTNKKTCPSCKKLLPVIKFYKSTTSEDGYSERCKACSRKSHAAIAVVELLDYVEPHVLFLKNDLLDKVDNRMQFLDYLWTLQEVDLLKYDSITDKYKLKQKNEIDEFLNLYGNQTHGICDTVKPTATKIVKQCPICQKTLSTSKYYKSSTTEDGYSKNCKDCTDKINAANILDKIQEYINIGIPFTKKELSDKLNNSINVDSYIWTLQEHDLIEHNDKLDTYKIKINSKFEEFYNKYIQPKPVKNVEEGSTEALEDKDITEKREIIYLSDNYEGRINIIMNAIIKNEELISLIEGLNSFLSSNLNKFMVFKCSDNFSEVMIDLEIDKKDKEKSLNQLNDKNWVNKTINL